MSASVKQIKSKLSTQIDLELVDYGSKESGQGQNIELHLKYEKGNYFELGFTKEELQNLKVQIEQFLKLH